MQYFGCINNKHQVEILFPIAFEAKINSLKMFGLWRHTKSIDKEILYSRYDSHRIKREGLYFPMLLLECWLFRCLKREYPYTHTREYLNMRCEFVYISTFQVFVLCCSLLLPGDRGAMEIATEHV